MADKDPLPEDREKLEQIAQGIQSDENRDDLSEREQRLLESIEEKLERINEASNRIDNIRDDLLG